MKVRVHHEEHVASQQQYVDVHCPAEKTYHFPVEEKANNTELITCAM